MVVAADEFTNKPSVEDHIYRIPGDGDSLSTVRETEPFKAQVTITNPYNRAAASYARIPPAYARF